MVTPRKTVHLVDEPVVAHPIVRSTKTSKSCSGRKVKVNVSLVNVDHITGLVISNLDGAVHIRHPTLNDTWLIACVLSHMCHAAPNSAMLLDVAPNATLDGT
jgi:hypothetical protein